jgi:PTS system nitrogen regulatory IIA component
MAGEDGRGALVDADGKGPAPMIGEFQIGDPVRPKNGASDPEGVIVRRQPACVYGMQQKDEAIRYYGSQQLELVRGGEGANNGIPARSQQIGEDMQLTVRELTEMFNVSEATVTRWIKQQALPAQRVAGQFRFNRFEVLDWAIAHQIKVESSQVEPQVDSQPWVSLAEALEAGGVHYKVPGDDQQAALRAVVSRLPLPGDFDRELLLRLLVAREALGSTAVGDGIAIPHARRPIVLHVPQPLVSLCFLKKPIVYQAPDGQPVRVLFSVISPTVTAHVQLLARLSRALHDPGFRKSIVGTKSRGVIVREARRIEKAEELAEGIGPRVA